MKLSHSLHSLSIFPAVVLGSVKFTIPEAGSVVKTGDVITAHWKENGNYPTIRELTRYDLYLCAGGDSPDFNGELEILIQDGIFERGNSVSFKVNAEYDGNDANKNAYFLKMASFGLGASVVNFSDRFSLVNMTDFFPDKVEEKIPSISDPSPNGFLARTDDDHEQLKKRQNIGAYTIPYNLQAGVERYAPMAKRPGTAITAKTASARYPTSAYTIATAYLPEPTVKTTLSAVNTHTALSIENTAAPASQPTIDAKMKQFLERWKD